jgi:hypothetical protein
MCDVSCIYSPKELERLSPEARTALQKALTKQIRASREMRVIQDAHLEVNKILKSKLRDTYKKLAKG